MEPIVFKSYAVEDISTTIEGYLGLCTLVMHTGHRCGYVGVPPGHVLHGVGYDDAILWHIEVHGGLTFAGRRSAEELNPELETYWALGFDCGHFGDAPDIKSCNIYWPKHWLKQENGHIWTLEEVREEVKKLSAQLTPEALMAQKLMEE